MSDTPNLTHAGMDVTLAITTDDVANIYTNTTTHKIKTVWCCGVIATGLRQSIHA